MCRSTLFTHRKKTCYPTHDGSIDVWYIYANMTGVYWWSMANHVPRNRATAPPIAFRGSCFGAPKVFFVGRCFPCGQDCDMMGWLIGFFLVDGWWWLSFFWIEMDWTSLLRFWNDVHLQVQQKDMGVIWYNWKLFVGWWFSMGFIGIYWPTLDIVIASYNKGLSQSMNWESHSKSQAGKGPQPI